MAQTTDPASMTAIGRVKQHGFTFPHSFLIFHLTAARLCATIPLAFVQKQATTCVGNGRRGLVNHRSGVAAVVLSAYGNCR